MIKIFLIKKITEIVKDIINDIDIKNIINKEMEKRWESRYSPLIENSKDVEKKCRDEVRYFLENAKLTPIISCIREEIREIIKNENK